MGRPPGIAQQAIWTTIEDDSPWPTAQRPRSVPAAESSESGGDQMSDAARVAEDFFDAWTSKDFERARSLLHDDVTFEGPIDRFDNADAYLVSVVFDARPFAAMFEARQGH
jgi:hypothetical protein